MKRRTRRQRRRAMENEKMGDYEAYRRERNRAKLRADGGWPSLIIWAAVAATGSGILFAILGSIK